MDWVVISAGICVVVALFYYWFTSTFNYWKSRGVVGPPPQPFFGNMSDIFLCKMSLCEYLKIAYDAYPEETMVGIFNGREPVLVLKDLDHISDVLIKDFSTFPSRGKATFNYLDGPLFDHLFNLEAARWRPLRVKLTPTFTSGKLKKMFHLVLESGDKLEKHVAKLTANNEPVVDCRELMNKYAIDVIANCVFDLQMNSLDDDNVLREVSREVLLLDWKRGLKLNIREYAPWLYPLIKPFMIDWKMTNLFVNMMRETMDYRKKNQIVRHDFIDLITHIRDNPNKVGDIEITDRLLAAQLFLFLIAGFETSANTMSYLLYELARNQRIQNKVRDEINRELAKNDGKITYESVKSYKYLTMVFNETLRLYPQGHTIARECAKEYTFAGTKLTIPAGMRVVIPIFAIQRNPLIYPEPEVFDPERFTDEAVKARHSCAWLSFGDGPRQCIGIRFAGYQSKIGLIKFLQRNKVEVCDKTEIPSAFDPPAFLLTPKNGIYLKISKIN